MAHQILTTDEIIDYLTDIARLINEGKPIPMGMVTEVLQQATFQLEKYKSIVCNDHHSGLYRYKNWRIRKELNSKAELVYVINKKHFSSLESCIKFIDKQIDEYLENKNLIRAAAKQLQDET